MRMRIIKTCLPVMLVICCLGAHHAQAATPDAEEQYRLGRYYSGMTGEKLDLQQAFNYTRQAAERGHAAAQVDLAFIYFNGNDKVPRDLALSLQWFRKAAGKGTAVAQCMLGDFYKGGLGGVKQDHEEAFKWYQLAATQQDKCAPKAQYELYAAYESGNGARKDLKAAMLWLVKAAEGGNPKAQLTLGRAHDKGYGVARDAVLAKKWIRKSREGVSWHEDHDEGERAGRGKAASHDGHRH